MVVEGRFSHLDTVRQIIIYREAFKKSFDTIYHGLLLMKSEISGIRGLVKSWLGSYLEDRYQYVSINSDLLKINCGVPQGSVLGPKWFVMYINYIYKVSKVLKVVLFFDGTNLYSNRLLLIFS